MNGETLLNRAVNPGWVQEEFVSTQAFKPTAKDGDKLSAFDNDLLNAEAAYDYYTEDLGNEAAGIIAVNVDECEKQSLSAYSDPTGGVPHEAHASIDFSGHGGSKRKRIAGNLRDAAKERGWCFQNTSAS